MDSFHNYLKGQLLQYVESERKRGIPLEEIEKVLLNAGHQKNIIDEVFSELKIEAQGKHVSQPKEELGGDLTMQLKGAFRQFLSQASGKEVKEAKSDFTRENTTDIVEEVIEESEIIEEKTMLESTAFFVYLIFIGLVILFSAGGTDSNLASVSIGFLPAIISIFASFMLLSLADNVPVYMFVPLGISGLFYAIGKFTGLPLFAGYDMEPLAIVNFLFGFAFNVIVVYVRFVKPSHMKRRVRQSQPQQGMRTRIVRVRKEIDDLRGGFRA